MSMTPPPVIDSARVLSYALVDDIPYRQSGSLFVDGKLLGAVPRLAIVVNLGEDIGPMLYHCDEEWQVLGVSGAGTIDDIKNDAARSYPGVSARWVDLNTSVEVALDCYDQQSGDLKCAFCGGRPFDLEGWVEGSNAIICNACIQKHYHAIHEVDGQSESD